MKLIVLLRLTLIWCFHVLLADMFINLSEEDRNMLVRWNKMQDKAGVASRAIPEATISKVSSMLRQRTSDVACKTVQVATSKIVGDNTEVHLPRVVATSRPDCVASFFTDANWSLVPTAVQRETVHDTDLSNLTSTTLPIHDDVIVVPDSSDLQLIDQCIAGGEAASWSPSEFISNGDADISKPFTDQMSSTHVTGIDVDSGATVARLPVMVESLSLDCFGLSTLDYVPTEQFKDTLTLADIVGSGNRDTVTGANGGAAAVWTSCDRLSVLCAQHTSNTSQTCVPLETTSCHGGFKLFSGVMTTDTVEPSRDEGVSLSSMMQIGSAGSGAGYGLGYDIDALLPNVEIDGM